jgi:hypothetical protein
LFQASASAELTPWARAIWRFTAANLCALEHR